jgi:predicted DsbA family dithiol-disulfide isomerase
MHVEIWSDIACPWCYVGKRRFEAALAAFPHRDQVHVTWRSFELDPGAPAERAGSRDAHLAEKYGTSLEQARAMHDRMTETAAGEGLDFRFDIARSANTFDAHRVLHLAAERGVQDAVKERLLRAHFTEGELVSDHEVLARLAGEAGLDAGEVREVLATDAYADAVRDDERTAGSLGITAVPFFVVDRALGAAGAQPPEVLGGLLEQGWAARSPLAVVADGDACGIDGC